MTASPNPEPLHSEHGATDAPGLTLVPDQQHAAQDHSVRHAASSQRVMRGALALFSIQPLTWAASFLMIVYTPQYLSSAAMGQWAVLTALSGIGTVVLGLGVPTVLIRQVAAASESTPRSAAASLVLLGVVSIIGAVLVALLVRTFHLIDLPPLTLELTLAATVTSLIQQLLLSILNGQHRLGRFAGLSALGAVTTSVASVATLMLGGGLVGVLVVGLVVALATTALGWRTSGVSVDWSGATWPALRALAISGLPFAGTALVLRLRGDAEVMLLGLGLSIEVLGWWAAAERISYIALFIPTLLMTPLLPALAAVADDITIFRETLRRSLGLTIVLTLGASTGIVAIAPIVPHTFGWAPEFVAAIPLIEILALVAPLISVGMILGTALIALGDERRWFVTSVVASSLHLIVTPALIFGFNAWGNNGGVGAALAKLLIEVLMVGGALYLLPAGSVHRSSWMVALKSVIASLVMIGAVRLLLSFEPPFALPLSMLTGGTVFLATLAALRVMPASELAGMAGFVRDTIRRKAG
ncbi:MAG: oligosaccharide flippase family protein [Chloroflexota bacterium]